MPGQLKVLTNDCQRNQADDLTFDTPPSLSQQFACVQIIDDQSHTYL